jgi:hypothetical protein
MNKIEDRSTAQSVEKMTGRSNLRKSQTLRLEKQIIRTLTGAELKLAGGGCSILSIRTCGGESRVTQ